MSLLRVLIVSLLTVTTQLSVRSDGDGAGADDKVDSLVYEFGGFFEFVGQVSDAPAAPGEQAAQQQLVGHDRKSDEAWPVGSWHAPLRSNETYPGKANWPLFDTPQCSADDMTVINYWALKQAKKTLPQAARAGDFKTGSCYKTFTTDWWFGISQWVSCYQEFYNVSTPCATCIGSVYNMAKYNMSENCYNLCKGRPSRRDGSHWCWEDCQQCMWYVGRKLSDCYGEPYDMTCRYGKELGKEGYFEKNGIDPKR
ncbi:unnamed protein product [Prorocentrum cordatum]|uniref:Uncharacterized protein n=1 Tax=Prorocentrum cordatum TaxID=2364126 RepID=A0ABN9XP71_9DINO|nr:unnamed protein product [Polarella glacialis]